MEKSCSEWYMAQSMTPNQKGIKNIPYPVSEYVVGRMIINRDFSYMN